MTPTTRNAKNALRRCRGLVPFFIGLSSETAKGFFDPVRQYGHTDPSERLSVNAVKRGFSSIILIFFVCLFLCLASTSSASLIVNGSFENIIANGSLDNNGGLVNPSNAVFNSVVPNVTAYGVREGIDLFTGGLSYGLAPQDGLFQVAAASDGGGTAEEFSMELTGSLTVNEFYKLDFYMQKLVEPPYDHGSVEIGLSTNATSFGTLIWSATSPTSGWLLSSTTFQAPNAGSFITVRVTTDDDNWVGLDNFQLNVADVAPSPEPSTFTLAALMGILMLSCNGRRRRRR